MINVIFSKTIIWCKHWPSEIERVASKESKLSGNSTFIRDIRPNDRHQIPLKAVILPCQWSLQIDFLCPVTYNFSAFKSFFHILILAGLHTIVARIIQSLKNTSTPINYESGCQKIPRLLNRRCSFLQNLFRFMMPT